MEKIDNWILAKVFQPLSNLFQDLSDRSGFYVAAIAYAGSLLFSLVLAYLASLERESLRIFSFLALGLVAYFFTRRMIRHDLRYLQKGDATNPYRADSVFMLNRIFFLMAVVLPDSWDFVHALLKESVTRHEVFRFLFVWALLAAFNFEACETKPPKPKTAEIPEGAT